uniref:non-specific serine/threonine protein kinase n=1 Tax=Ciona intestinalis TaxID=7719 RepID=F7APE7_CIOIN
LSMPFSSNPRRSGSLTDIRTRIITEPWQNFFNIEDTIGRGKFAVVKKCVEKSSGRRFAAKCIRKRRHCRDCTPDIFHEIAVLEISTHHPHLINLYKVYETTTEVTLILEYAAGGEIFDHCIGVKDPFNETTTRRLLQQILEAVDFLHSNNIVHLDLKPQNILLTEGGVDGDIKLVDFGLSKILAQEIEIREILGTPDYVAPEVLNFEPISTLTDIWSLGVVCYVMLTGVSPFLGDNKNETLMNVTTGVLDFPDDLFKSKNAACKDLMTKMLQRDPSMRINARECLQHPWL